MDFDKFLGASFVPRTVTIEVPELKAYFPGQKAEWTVRNLTAAELGRAEHIASEKTRESIKGLLLALKGHGDVMDAAQKAIGISEKEVPEDITRRIEMLVAGSVEPKLGTERRDVAVYLSENFSTIFYRLTNEILNLTGKGAEVGKRKPSGKAAKSETT